MEWADKLAEMLRQGSDTLVNLPSEAQRFITNPQAFTELFTGKNPLPQETGFAAGATGLQPKNPAQGGVLNPAAAPYTKGYEAGEPFTYASALTPLGKPFAKAIAPKAYDMLENYMVKSGGMIPLEAYHGTPHNIQGKFDISKVGTGEGNQTFGHGMYFAENPKVAGEYASKLGGDKGNLYKVNIPDENIPMMLDWDKPLIKQTPQVQEALAKANPKFYDPKSPNYDPNESGQWAYMSVAGNVTPEAQQAASAKLNELGIKGIRYSDAGSRGKTSGTSNFVVFDPSTVKMLEENGKSLTRKELIEQQLNKVVE